MGDLDGDVRGRLRRRDDRRRLRLVLDAVRHLLGVRGCPHRPFLAGGELVLLFRQPWVRWATWIVLIFSVAFTFSVLQQASFEAARCWSVSSGKEVFGDGSAAHRLPQLFSYPAFFILVAGALWSAWKMRGRPS